MKRQSSCVLAVVIVALCTTAPSGADSPRHRRRRARPKGGPQEQGAGQQGHAEGQLPKPQEADLSNGVHLMVLEDHRLPQVIFQMIIDGAGGYYDPPQHARARRLHRAR